MRIPSISSAAKTYVAAIPKAIPKGRILVHNSVRPKNFGPQRSRARRALRLGWKELDIYHVPVRLRLGAKVRRSFPRAR